MSELLKLKCDRIELVTSHYSVLAHIIYATIKRNEGLFKSTWKNLFIAIIVHVVTRHKKIIFSHVGTDFVLSTNEPPR